jgi:uncharacterized protein
MLFELPDILQYLTVRVTADDLRAFVSGPLPEDMHLTQELWEQILARDGITTGITEMGIEELDGKLHEREEFCIAGGIPPVHGTDGSVELLFNNDSKGPAAGENGVVNLHELQWLHNVRSGDRIARVLPPQKGELGTTIKGNPIIPHEGKKGILHCGPNTRTDSDDPTLVVAVTDGNVVWRNDGSIEVLTVVLINGNVDFSTGNINFVGSLVVRGDVKSDFSIKVDRDLTVFGDVEDAHIEAGGNIKIRKGFIGCGKGICSAGGNVEVHNVLNQTIIAKGDIVVAKEAVGGVLKADGKIMAQHATIVGTQVESKTEVNVKNLGSMEGAVATVRVGRKGRILDRLAQIDKELKQLEKQTADVKDAVFRLIRLKLDKGTLDNESENRLVKLQEVQKMHPAMNEKLMTEKNSLLEELRLQFDGRVVVTGTIYENILIEINGVRKRMETAIKGAVFCVKGDAVEIQGV